MIPWARNIGKVSNADVQPLTIDPKGDVLSDYGNLKSFYGVMDDRYFYLMIEVYDEKIAPMFVINIDTDLDGQDDYYIHSAR